MLTEKDYKYLIERIKQINPIFDDIQLNIIKRQIHEIKYSSQEIECFNYARKQIFYCNIEGKENILLCHDEFEVHNIRYLEDRKGNQYILKNKDKDFPFTDYGYRESEKIDVIDKKNIQEDIKFRNSLKFEIDITQKTNRYICWKYYWWKFAHKLLPNFISWFIGGILMQFLINIII